MRRLLLWLLPAIVVFAALLPADAWAVRFRRPYDTGHGMGAGFDNNGRSGVCTDYNCGNRCYDGHTGTDYPMPVGTAIVAPANGTVTNVVYAGCADYGYYGNTCGGYCGNHVSLRWDDGTTSVLCHMRAGTIVVNTGQRVSCGQYLGQSASSGSSTGPHLHFGWRRSSGSTDVYAGSCSGSPGGWVDQGAYWGIPGTGCESSCECSPGQVQRENCGRCGTRERGCGGDCRWGGWSACSGEGPCWPGAREEQACCDCGTQARVCNGACQWDGWGACGGPDPDGGARQCDTGEPGVCADGRVRCVGGCTACVRLTEPSDEVCDDLDNNCDANTDEGAPQILGAQPPRFAARLADVSAPGLLQRGERAEVWLRFENVGREPWPAGEIWLVSRAARAGAISPLYSPTWPAWDVAAIGEQYTEPGELATFVFYVEAAEGIARGELVEMFELVDPTDAPLRCPSPGLDLDVLIDDTEWTGGGASAGAYVWSGETTTPEPDAVDTPDTELPGADVAEPGPPRRPDDSEPGAASYSSEASCSAAAGGAMTWPLWLGVALVAFRRRRPTSGPTHCPGC